MAGRADLTDSAADPERAAHLARTDRAGMAIAKTRSRKDGAAVPLDDLDRKLLNLMQGSFPIARRPYRRVAELGGVGEAETMGRAPKRNAGTAPR
jgi:hypothetical protein